MARRSKGSDNLNIPVTVGSVKKSTSDIVYETLREAILNREIPEGTPLVEAQLAQRFGVSKTPIREALQRLTHTGLVDFELAKGATIHTLTPEEIRDIWEMRVYLESFALTQSAPQLTADELHTLDRVLDDARAALEKENYQRLSQLNSQFHQTLYSKATNHLLVRWLDSLADLRRLISMHGWAIENRSMQEWQEHRGILDAVKAGDVELAAERLREHINRFARLVLQQADGQEETSSSDGHK